MSAFPLSVHRHSLWTGHWFATGYPQGLLAAPRACRQNVRTPGKMVIREPWTRKRAQRPRLGV